MSISSSFTLSLIGRALVTMAACRNSPTAEALMPRADPIRDNAGPPAAGTEQRRCCSDSRSMALWKRRACLPFEQALLGIHGWNPRSAIPDRRRRGPACSLCSDLQSEIVRHSKNPSPWVLDFFALSERGIQPQKHLLGPLLRLRGIKPEAQQVTVYVFARLQKQLSHLILQGQGGLFLERDTRVTPSQANKTTSLIEFESHSKTHGTAPVSTTPAAK